MFLYVVDYCNSYEHFIVIHMKILFNIGISIESMINCSHIILYLGFFNCNSCVYEFIYEISNNFNPRLRKKKKNNSRKYVQPCS